MTKAKQISVCITLTEEDYAFLVENVSLEKIHREMRNVVFDRLGKTYTGAFLKQKEEKPVRHHLKLVGK